MPVIWDREALGSLQQRATSTSTTTTTSASPPSSQSTPPSASGFIAAAPDPDTSPLKIDHILIIVGVVLALIAIVAISIVFLIRHRHKRLGKGGSGSSGVSSSWRAGARGGGGVDSTVSSSPWWEKGRGWLGRARERSASRSATRSASWTSHYSRSSSAAAEDPSARTSGTSGTGRWSGSTEVGDSWRDRSFITYLAGLVGLGQVSRRGGDGHTGGFVLPWNRQRNRTIAAARQYDKSCKHKHTRTTTWTTTTTTCPSACSLSRAQRSSSCSSCGRGRTRTRRRQQSFESGLEEEVLPSPSPSGVESGVVRPKRSLGALPGWTDRVVSNRLRRPGHEELEKGETRRREWGEWKERAAERWRVAAKKETERWVAGRGKGREEGKGGGEKVEKKEVGKRGNHGRINEVKNEEKREGKVTFGEASEGGVASKRKEKDYGERKDSMGESGRRRGDKREGGKERGQEKGWRSQTGTSEITETTGFTRSEVDTGLARTDMTSQVTGTESTLTATSWTGSSSETGTGSSSSGYGSGSGSGSGVSGSGYTYGTGTGTGYTYGTRSGYYTYGTGSEMTETIDGRTTKPLRVDGGINSRREVKR